MGLFSKAICLVLIGIMVCGCSNGGTAIALQTVQESNSGHQPDIAESSHYLWAYSLVNLNLQENEFDIIPLRQVSDHWNILRFLEQGPCTNCIKITHVEPSGHGTHYVDIRIKHPYESATLTGFDVRGIAMFTGSHDFPVAGLNMPDCAFGDGELVNADGYTTLYNVETSGNGPNGMQGYFSGKFSTANLPDAHLNGFRRFNSAGYENKRNAFYSDDALIVTYEIKFPHNALIFGYAVDASWIPPVNVPVTDPMMDFSPDANCPEAWKINVQDNGPGLDAQGGTTLLQIDIFDWQGKDEVHPVTVECPELFDGEVEGTWISDEAGFTRYVAEIENTKLSPPGTFSCLVRKPAQENDPVAKPWLDLTAYGVFPVEVGWPDGYPVDVTPHSINFVPEDICVDDTRAYIASDAENLHVLDVSDPEFPVWIKYIDTHCYASNVAVSENYAFVTGNCTYVPYKYRLDLIDIEPLELAHIVNTVICFGTAFAFEVMGGYGYVIMSQQSGLTFHVLDLDPPDSAELVGGAYLPYHTCGDLAVSGSYAYITHETDGLLVYDIDPPELTHQIYNI